MTCDTCRNVKINFLRFYYRIKEDKIIIFDITLNDILNFNSISVEELIKYNV
jgi:hypothetical protein